MPNDKQKFRFVVTWEIASVGVLKISAMRSAMENLFHKHVKAGNVIITEVTEIESTIVSLGKTASSTNTETRSMQPRTGAADSQKDKQKKGRST